MWYYIIFLSHKPTKVTSDFIVNYLKKVIGGATTQKNLKTNTKTLIYPIWTHPQGPQKTYSWLKKMKPIKNNLFC